MKHLVKHFSNRGCLVTKRLIIEFILVIKKGFILKCIPQLKTLFEKDGTEKVLFCVYLYMNYKCYAHHILHNVSFNATLDKYQCYVWKRKKKWYFKNTLQNIFNLWLNVKEFFIFLEFPVNERILQREICVPNKTY